MAGQQPPRRPSRRGRHRSRRTSAARPGDTAGRRRVARSDWPIRIAQTLPTPTIAEQRDDDVRRQDRRRRRCRRRLPAPTSAVARPGRQGRTSRAGPPPPPGRTSVIPKIRPTAQELKCGPGAAAPAPGRGRRGTRTGRRRATSPRSSAGRVCRSGRPPQGRAAAGRSRWRASSGAAPKTMMTAASSHISPQWYQVCAGRPSSCGEARRRVDRLGPGLGEIRAEDRVVRLVHDLERLDAVARALDEGRAVQQRHGDDEHARRRRRPRRGSGDATIETPDRRLDGRRTPSVVARIGRRPPAPDGGQPDRDREADRHRGERAATTRCDRRPPGGHDQQARCEPDAERLAGRRVGGQQPDEARDPDAEQQADRAEQQPLADRQPDRAVGQRDAEAPKTPPDYTVGRSGCTRPDGQGTSSTVGPFTGRHPCGLKWRVVAPRPAQPVSAEELLLSRGK